MNAEQNDSDDAAIPSGGWSNETQTTEDILLAALGDANTVGQYRREMDFFSDALTRLSVNIYAVERILEFPIDLFLDGSPEDSTFLSQVVDNFLDASVLLITRLVVDQGPDIHSLRSFHAWVMQTVTPAYRGKLQQQLISVGFRRRDDELLRRLESLRNRRIAHTLNDYFHEVTSAQAVAVRVDFKELKALRDELSAYLNALAFDTEYILLPLGYDPGESDIERLLDVVARSSYLLNLPEQQPDFWEAQRSQLTPAQLAQINAYRKKFGLSEA